MPEKRSVEIIRVDEFGNETREYTLTHKPAEFLVKAGVNLAIGEKAQPGKVYELPGGPCPMVQPTITYNRIPRATYDGIKAAEAQANSIQLESDGVSLADFLDDEPSLAELIEDKTESVFAELDAALDAIEEKVVAIEEATRGSEFAAPELTPILVREATCGGERTFTGERFQDDNALEFLGAPGLYFNARELAELVLAAPSNGYTIVYVGFEPPIFTPDNSLPEGAGASLEAPRAVPAFKVTVPAKSKRQQRRRAGCLFG